MIEWWWPRWSQGLCSYARSLIYDEAFVSLLFKNSWILKIHFCFNFSNFSANSKWWNGDGGRGAGQSAPTRLSVSRGHQLYSDCRWRCDHILGEMVGAFPRRRSAGPPPPFLAGKRLDVAALRIHWRGRRGTIQMFDCSYCIQPAGRPVRPHRHRQQHQQSDGSDRSRDGHIQQRHSILRPIHLRPSSISSNER